MPKKIGDSENDPRAGGETWTVQWRKPGSDHEVVGLSEGDRFRLEHQGNEKKIWMYPAVDTVLYQDGNKKIKLVRSNEEDPVVYEYSIKFSGEEIPLWWVENDAPEQGEESSIWTYNPMEGGPQPGGSAGNRR